LFHNVNIFNTNSSFRFEWKNIKNLDNFFTYWTLKESFIKTSGLGLKQNLLEIEFQFENENYFIKREENLKFKTIKLNDQHMLSLCFNKKEENVEILQEFIKN
jgi:4'-phosphopantetheinyl transferase